MQEACLLRTSSSVLAFNMRIAGSESKLASAVRFRGHTPHRNRPVRPQDHVLAYARYPTPRRVRCGLLVHRVDAPVCSFAQEGLPKSSRSVSSSERSDKTLPLRWCFSATAYRVPNVAGRPNLELGDPKSRLTGRPNHLECIRCNSASSV